MPLARRSIKFARLLGLGFPGGPAIQRAAEGAPGGVVLPRAWLRDSYDFSFSGLKTAVLHQIRDYQAREAALQPGTGKSAGKRGVGAPSAPPEATATPHLPPTVVARLARAFQESVVDVLVTKTVEAARACGAAEILLAGGVAANLRLREELNRRAPVPVRVPPVALCTDNAAMIGAAAFYRFDAGIQHGWNLDIQPNLGLNG
jgi:N6-L-threonylcarbamoyladenine synthase